MNVSLASRQSREEPQIVPSHAELIARANGLQELLWAGAPNSDKNRRLDDTTVAAIDNAGITRMFVPRRFGGYEADVQTMLEVLVALARGDGSAAWVTGIGTATAYMLGLFPEEAQTEIWGANPDARICGVLAPSATAAPTEGGYIISGSWGYVSGCLHADWTWLCFPKADGEIALAIVPLKDLKILDTWHTTGMRGTGSNTVVADKLFVPSHRYASLFAAIDGNPPALEAILRENQTLYRSSFMGVFLLSLVGISIGEAQAALKIVIEKSSSRGITTTLYAKQAAAVAFQLDVAAASVKIDTALTLARGAAREVDEIARTGGYPTTEQRISARTACALAVKLANEAMEMLMTAHGSSAFTENNPLSRIWRNISVAARHGGFSHRIADEVYGRILLGLDTTTITAIV